MGYRSKGQSTGRRVWKFLLGFLRSPEGVASIVPSSRFVQQRVVDKADAANARVIVELGPGVGVVTTALLDAMPEDAILVAIDVDPKFIEILKENPDARLITHRGSAEYIGETLAENSLRYADAVVSGIPFSTMPRARGRYIINEIRDCLRPGGKFVAYQFRDRVAELGREVFGEPDIEMEPLNVPPTRIFTWRKPDEEGNP